MAENGVMTPPMVSVLMTAYNREKFIGQAIESVLASNFTDFELIITDDCSKDNTVAIARAYAAKDARVKVFINGKNLGDYPNRNQAATHATGKYIKYLDSDDMIYYYGLDVMVNYMERFPDAGFGLSSSSLIDIPPFPMCITPAEIYRENFNGFGHFDRSPGSGIIRLDAFRKVGGFSGKRMIGDYEFWFKIARYYKMVKLPSDLYYYRWSHGEQETGTAYAQEYPAMKEQVLKEALEHPDCPLSAEEIAGIRRTLQRQKKRYQLTTILSPIKRLFK
jgi:glycosyltransferase involved in cell wall biosynthesis